jgi:hypothetical protein
MLEIIALWLVANYDLPHARQPPALVRVTEAELVELRYGPDATVPPGMVVAVYDDAGRTIYLAEGWTGATPGTYRSRWTKWSTTFSLPPVCASRSQGSARRLPIAPRRHGSA